MYFAYRLDIVWGIGAEGRLYWVEWCCFEIHENSKSQEVTLLGNRVFVDIIKL